MSVVRFVVVALFLLAACGDDAGHGGTPDAAVDAPPPGSLTFTGPVSFETYTCARFVVAARDPSGAATPATAPIAVTIGGTATGTAVFASLADCRANTAGNVEIQAGRTEADVYVRANAAGPLALTASATGYTGANVTATVTLFEVLGQPDATVDVHAPLNINFNTPVIAGGKLIVADQNTSRVLIWNALPTTATQPPDISIGTSSPYALDEPGSPVSGAVMSSPQGVWSDGTRLVVSDTNRGRVLVWTTFPTASGQPASFALGQPAGATNLTSSGANNGGLSGSSLNDPGAVWSDGTRLYVCDRGNHRVLVWTTFPTAGGTTASFALGQPDLTTNTPGLGASALDGPDGVVGSGSTLYVSDTNNNRVLGWTTLPAASGAPATFALGQTDLTSNADVQPTTAATLTGPRGLATTGTRLFVADTMNNRVLAWTTLPATSAAAADFVLGQPTFASSQVNADGRAKGFSRPQAVATDGTRLFVGDSFNLRLLVWPTLPTATGTAASFAIGQASSNALSDSERLPPSGTVLGRIAAIASDGTRLFVVDNGHNRVLVWNALPTSSSTPADFALGQAPGATNLTTSFVNGGPATGFVPTASTLNNPFGVFVDGTRLYVADSGNSRILVWNTLPTTGGQPADFALGQPAGSANLTTGTQNTDGLSASSMSVPTAIARHGTRLFVADAANNRVLVWDTIPTAGGQAASFALGQPAGGSNLTSGAAASPPTASSLFAPHALLVVGNQLFVADRLNARVMVWNTIPTTGGTPASTVLGQLDFVSRATTLSASSMFSPTGLAASGTRLFVSDAGAHRVLSWNTIPTTTVPADRVFGQADFAMRQPNRATRLSATSLRAPAGLLADGPRVFVSDAENHRMLIIPSFP